MAVIAKELVFKILAIATAGGTVAGGGVVLNNYLREVPEIEELKKIGLSCRKDHCTSFYFGKDGFSIKQDNETRAVDSLTSFKGKIRIQTGEGEGLDKYTFHIEDGEISLAGKDSSQTSQIIKLEEFETYVIEEKEVEDKAKKYHFKRKTKAADEVKKLLGITDPSCTLPEGEPGSTTCTLDVAKLKAINFEGKSKTEGPTISESGTVTLTISGMGDTVGGEKGPKRYPLGYSFELSGDKQVTIPTSSENIIKKAGDTIEFRIKKKGRNLTLEKIWDVERLAWKLGFSDCKKEKGVNTCRFPETATLNVYKDAENSIKETKVTNQTISFEEKATGFEGEVKFKVDAAIPVKGGTKKGTFENIEAGDYEIKEQTVDNNKA